MTEPVEGAVMGRPTDYLIEYCEKIIKFFDREPIETIEIPYEDKNGETQIKILREPCQCPTFEKFSADIGVSRQTLLAWTKKNPDFLVAYERARCLQANIMMVNGMSGAYSAAFTNLSMKNMHGWADKQEIENSHTVQQMPTVKIGGDELIFDVGEDDVKEIEG